MTQTAKKTIQPVGTRVIVQRIEAEEKQGGIILPESAKTKQETATVIAVGEGKDKPDIKAGDTVLIDKYAGQDVTLAGEEFTIVRFDDVVAKLED